MPARPLSEEQILETIDALERAGGNQAEAARILGRSTATVHNRVRVLVQMGRYSIAGGQSNVDVPLPRIGSVTQDDPWDLPQSLAQKYTVHRIDGEHKVLIIGDVHVPYHDVRALEASLNYGLKVNVDTIILNGDIIDMQAVSRHERNPNERMGIAGELHATRGLLKCIREGFPNARIIYNEGNHEMRLPRWLAMHAPELWNLSELHLPNILHCHQHRIEYIPTADEILLGRLYVHHGHELGRVGIYAARQTLLDAFDNVIFGHTHRSQSHIHRSIGDRLYGGWNVGCMCDLRPSYRTRNQWVHGFAIVETGGDGEFHVDNRIVQAGKLF